MIEKDIFQFEINDEVFIINELNPIIYIIKKICKDEVELIGKNYRIMKKENIGNLKKATKELIDNEEKNIEKYYLKINNFKNRQPRKYILGKVLHIDGDSNYLNKCLELYKEVGVYAFGVTMDEEYIYKEIAKYINEINPDIIVITGHDLYNKSGIKNLDNYINSKHFIKAIKEIRKIDRNVVIISGACQSNFEAMIASGANFASSPKRINIHTFDPAIVAIKSATTSFTKIININETYKYIENGKDAFGGIETFGKMRLLL